jgi:SAF domain
VDVSNAKQAQRRGVPVRPRNPARVAIAVLLVVGSALLTMQLYRSAGERKPYLVLVNDVPVGQRLTDADLRTAEIATDVGVTAVPAGNRASVVGQVVRTPLAKGQLLTTSALATDSVVPQGKAVVALSVPEGVVPDNLRSGDRIWLIVRSSDDPGAVAGAVDATLYNMTSSDSAAGFIIITALVDVGRVNTVSVAAASERVSVVQVDPTAPAPAELPPEVVVP